MLLVFTHCTLVFFHTEVFRNNRISRIFSAVREITIRHSYFVQTPFLSGAASILNGDFKMLAVLGVEDVLLTDLDILWKCPLNCF